MSRIKEKLEILNEPERTLYRAEIITILAVLLFYLVMIGLQHFVPAWNGILDCQIKKMTGIPCPACGGTRSVYYLFTGHLFKSLYYHAAVTYTVVLAVIFFITQSLRLLTNGKVKGLSWHNWYWVVGLVIFFVQYILKLMIPGYVI